MFASPGIHASADDHRDADRGHRMANSYIPIDASVTPEERTDRKSVV